MSFKIPVFQPQITPESIHSWFVNYFGHSSRSELIIKRLITLPGWDMSSTLVPPSIISVGEFINPKRITDIAISIFSDAGQTYIPSRQTLDWGDLDTDGITVNASIIMGEFFNSVGFSDTSVSRGQLTLCYTT